AAQHLPSFPARRSSDLIRRLAGRVLQGHAKRIERRTGSSFTTRRGTAWGTAGRQALIESGRYESTSTFSCVRDRTCGGRLDRRRSEEHTSELQSRENVV